MLDVIFIALVLIFFGGALWYVRFCERVWRRDMDSEGLNNSVVILAMILLYCALVLSKVLKSNRGSKKWMSNTWSA